LIDEHRVKLVEQLVCGPCRVGVVVARLSLTVAAASRDLQQGLTTERRDGRHMVDRLADVGVADIVAV
jgi:hypothetical protein